MAGSCHDCLKNLLFHFRSLNSAFHQKIYIQNFIYICSQKIQEPSIHKYCLNAQSSKVRQKKHKMQYVCMIELSMSLRGQEIAHPSEKLVSKAHVHIFLLKRYTETNNLGNKNILILLPSPSAQPFSFTYFLLTICGHVHESNME